ncbi:MAG: nitrile hydratase subunit beta [Chloroflexi bacterium]|nr:nitrile hydratase subunit beta [Chloroflexota bacterium]
MAAAIEGRYRPGDRVRVRVAAPAGHVRTPGYIQGKVGRVDVLLGSFPNPESLAYGGDGLPELPLYRVEFRQTEVWDRYGGPPHDKLYVDLFQHWLESA